MTFPYDNLLIAIGSVIFLKIFIITQASTKDIEEHIKDVLLEVENLKNTSILFLSLKANYNQLHLG